METGFLIRRGYLPHNKTHKKNGRYFLRLLLVVVLLFVAFTLRFYLPFFTIGVSNFLFEYKHIDQTIQELPGIGYLFSLINPEFQKRRQAIQEILVIFEKYETGLAEVTKEELAEVIYEEASRHNHDPKFILAIIANESSFQNWSVSEKGAKGLMQIMPYVAESIAHELGIEWSGDRTLFNPFINIKMGIHYLSKLFLDFKDDGLALTAYNYGPTYVRGLIERKKKIPQDYSKKILNTYEYLLTYTKAEDPLLPVDITIEEIS